jgi:hypothetical protein
MRLKPLSATAEMLKVKHAVAAAEVRKLEVEFEQRAEEYFMPTEEQRQKLELLRVDAGHLLKALETELQLNDPRT